MHCLYSVLPVNFLHAFAFPLFSLSQWAFFIYIAAYLIMQIKKQQLHIYFLCFKCIQRPGRYIEMTYIFKLWFFFYFWEEFFEVLILWFDVLILWLSTWKGCVHKNLKIVMLCLSRVSKWHKFLKCSHSLPLLWTIS